MLLKKLKSWYIPAIVPLFLTCNTIQKAKQIFQTPDVTPLRETLRIALPLGYAASLAMWAVKGDTIAGVSVVGDCSVFPCNALVCIDVDSTGLVPPGVGSNQTIVVAGLWSDSAGMAFMSIFFTDLDPAATTFTLANVHVVPVIAESSVVRVVYAREDVNPGSDTVLTVDLTDAEKTAELTRLQTRPPADSTVVMEQEAWIIDVDSRGTPGVLTDDIYTVMGGGQFVEAGAEEAYILQLVFIDVRTDAGCFNNPYEGIVMSRNTGVTTSDAVGTIPLLGTVVFTFHRNCNGRVDVPVATGVYTPSSGSSFNLDIAAP